jgi:hypothetical protein
MGAGPLVSTRPCLGRDKATADKLCKLSVHNIEFGVKPSPMTAGSQLARLLILPSSRLAVAQRTGAA